MKQNTCTYCNRKFDISKDIFQTGDHFYPKSQGGKKIVPSCQFCNQLKADKTPEQFLQLIEFLTNSNYRELMSEPRLMPRFGIIKSNLKKLIEQNDK